MMREVSEREAKWEVAERFELPDLRSIVVGGHITHDTVDLVSEYYDTSQRDLLAHGVLLQRRSGDDDTGWRLTLPTAEESTELQWPLTDAPPESLLELLTGISVGKDVAAIATVHTIRSRYRIHDEEARELSAELADDQVRAWAGERLLAWREIEVDLGPTTPSIPKGFVKSLRAAGARPSRHRSALARVLPPQASAGARSATARGFVEYVDAQIDQIVAGDIGLRRGQDPIHDTRVAMRRLRSTLRVFAEVLDGPADLEVELKWFAGLLGEVRDCQVQQQRFTEALAELPEELVLGPVRTRVRHDLQAIELPARAQVREAMNSPRYLAILAALRRWRDDPPLLPGTTSAGLLKRARKAQRKADRRLAAALVDGDSVEAGALLHRARKASKRARYAAELCRDLAGSRRTKRTVKHYKRFQSILGDHQDAVVALQTLRRMGVAAGTTDGENGFTFGLLLARERRIAEDCRVQARKLA